ncbi:MAG: hypothetical protein PVG65_01135 [Candidatus Thorarchaeota archaeon]|jgi:hypothetical protein
MLVLKEKEMCPHGERCQYSHTCWGLVPNRQTIFTCTFIREDGSIKDGQVRHHLDVTGKMKLIMENNDGSSNSN